MKVTFDPVTKELTIVVKANDTTPPVSPSGKTRSVASSKGNVPTAVTICGKTLIIGLNAYIPNK